VFKSSGTGRCPGLPDEFGPNGVARQFFDLLRALPVNQAGRGALIGRVGDESVARPFFIGAAGEIVTPLGGIVALGINRTGTEVCGLEYSVHVDVFPPPEGAQLVVVKEVAAIDGVDRKLFDRLPRRVADNQRNAGDMVNFLILGSEDAMQRAFTTAGWVRVDADITTAVLSGILGGLSKEAYVSMPMSELFLFGRRQDYGWAHAEPIKVVAARHHLRLWKASFDVSGSTLWVGAATHDIGFERDRRNNGVTHRIDPDVDLERTYVEKTLTATGLVVEFTYVLPDNPVREAQTATGGSFHSDGRVLILKLDDVAAGDALQVR
jgi:hypothetical protein